MISRPPLATSPLSEIELNSRTAFDPISNDSQASEIEMNSYGSLSIRFRTTRLTAGRSVKSLRILCAISNAQLVSEPPRFVAILSLSRSSPCRDPLLVATLSLSRPGNAALEKTRNSGEVRPMGRHGILGERVFGAARCFGAAVLCRLRRADDRHFLRGLREGRGVAERADRRSAAGGWRAFTSRRFRRPSCASSTRGGRKLSRRLAQLLAPTLRELPLTPGSVLAPVPLHRRRLATRGYNQAALLAARTSPPGAGCAVSRVCCCALAKTERQVGKARDERLLNAEGAFQLRRSVGAPVVWSMTW